MQKSILFATALLLCICVPLLAGDKMNFSGTWTVNKEKSKVDEQGYMFLPLKVVITHADNDFNIVRTFEGQSGEEIEDGEKLTLDGKECKSKVMGDWGDRVSTAGWSEDGKSIKVDTKLTFDQGDVVLHWLLGMEEGALVANYESTSSFGDRKVKLVFDKQEAK